jgi:hypothetical protein
MADILNAIAQAGFVIERLVERVGEDAARSAKGKLPYDFFVVARRGA